MTEADEIFKDLFGRIEDLPNAVVKEKLTELKETLKNGLSILQPWVRPLQLK